MVSGLVTSPWDQLRIFSGDARLMRIASKSAIVFCISNGLERNKVFLRFPRQYRCRLRPSGESGQWSVTSGQHSLWAKLRRCFAAGHYSRTQIPEPEPISAVLADHWPLATVFQSAAALAVGF